MYKMIASTVDYSHNREDCNDTMHLATLMLLLVHSTAVLVCKGVGVTAAQK
jgi:hypothetical protein